MPSQDGQFKPGHPGGPGRPQEPTKFMKEFTKIAVANELVDLMELTLEDLKNITNNKESKPITAVVAAYLLNCRKKGIFPDQILDRVIGKVPQKTELTGAEGVPFEPVRFAPYPGPDPYAKPAPPIAVEVTPSPESSGQAPVS